jgi:transcriptional antiterminator
MFEEIAYIAYHFHWSLEEILDLEHPLRQRFVEEIGRINERLADEE